MINYAEYLNLYGLSFKIGFDVDNDAEDFKMVLGVDYCCDPVIYDYWGEQMSFIGTLWKRGGLIKYEKWIN